MNIVIHGAINTSNFGDVLFAKMFYSACSDLPDSNVDFVQSFSATACKCQASFSKVFCHTPHTNRN